MFRVEELARIIPGSIPLGNMNASWNKVSIDSRTIQSGELFFALKGERYDGHDFIRRACENGASGIVLEKRYFQNHPSLQKDLKQPFLLVDHSVSALQLWARYYYTFYKPFTICITGSNGKTTTKEMIVHLLSTKYQVLKSRGNFNNEIGVPLTILDLDSHHDVMVIEMAARQKGEIRELTNIVQPDIAVITNIGEAHIGLFGSRENIAVEKSELISSLKEKGTVILNHDDAYYAYLKSRISGHREVLSFGFHPEAQLKALNYRPENEKGISFDISWHDSEARRLFIPIIGKFNVYNALAAIAVGIRMNLSRDGIIESLSNFKGLTMHMEQLMLDRDVMVIQDEYNANPTAVREALTSIAELSEGRFKAAVLGDMLELGSQAANFHHEVGRLAASLSFDMLIGYGEYSKLLVQGAREWGMAREMTFSFDVENREYLAKRFMKLIPDHSIVLLKGSRSMKMEEFARYWKEGSKTSRRDVHV